MVKEFPAISRNKSNNSHFSEVFIFVSRSQAKYSGGFNFIKIAKYAHENWHQGLYTL